MIRKCDYFDVGIYIFVVFCKGVDIYSNKFDLDIVKGRFFFLFVNICKFN